jgi:alpha-N-arabinofuranosidase
MMTGVVGTGTYEEALAWLEYCNGTGDTQCASLTRIVISAN